MIAPNLQSFPPKKRKLVRRIGVALLIYAVLGFFVVPPIVRAVAVKRLSRELDREVTIRKVRLNPFVFSATIRGLLIKDKDGEPFVSWDEVYVNFQLLSFLGRPWVFREVSTTKPFVRVQVNPDRSLNFSDLLDKFGSNAPAAKPAKPLALRIKRLEIHGASASLTDLTPRTPFQRILGPLDVTLENFHTDPSNRNPYSFAGTTDAGEKLAWSGHFYLDPLRSAGDLSLEGLALNKYAALYQDLVRFEIRDGVVDARATYRFEFSDTNQLAAVTNASFTLRSFKLADPGNGSNLVDLREFSVAGASLDVNACRAEVSSVSVTGGRLLLQRDSSRAINVVELSRPAATATNVPGGVLFLLHSVTNAVARLLDSTNAWAASLHEVKVRDCALNLEDLSFSRPARLGLDNITLTARNISNLPGTNLTASLALRWSTNGSIKADVTASALPLNAEVRLALDQVELGPLDPCLEPVVNLLILGSKLGVDARLHVRAARDSLPEVTFQGDVRLDDFATADGVLGEELLKWRSVRVSGIDAGLHPPTVAIREVAVDDAFARVVIETNRTINLLAALRLAGTNAPASGETAPSPPAGKQTPAAVPAAESDPASPATASASSLLPKISIATIVISNAQARFTDRSVTPNVNLSIQQAGGTIAGLSSEELQRGEINLHARVDNVGPAEITGTINPFSEQKTNDIKISLRDMDLTPASPYAGRFAGYRIAKGKLSLALAYHLRGRTLQSENLITLDQFTFGERVESPDATQLPVRLAVAILKDRNGKIELDVPIEGSLDDPEFRIGKVVMRTMMNLLTRVATSPFSLLGSLFGGKGEEIRYQDFAPGRVELLASGKDKLDALAKGLYERPGLQLEIEGSVDPAADRDGLRRVAIEKRLRAEKWMSLRKAARETTTVDQVELPPEERQELIRKFFREGVEKGEVNPSATNPLATAETVVALAGGPGATAPSSAVSRAGVEKGATRLLPGTEAELRPAPAVAAAPGFQRQEDPMELALLNSIAIGDNDFAALASERAKAVRAALLQAGQVEPERVFLTETQPGGVKTEGSRAYLQLR